MSSKYYMFIHIGTYQTRQVEVYYVPENAMDDVELDSIRNSSEDQVVSLELMRKIREHHMEGDVGPMRRNVKEVFMMLESSSGTYFTDETTI